MEVNHSNQSSIITPTNSNNQFADQNQILFSNSNLNSNMQLNDLNKLNQQAPKTPPIINGALNQNLNQNQTFKNININNITPYFSTSNQSLFSLNDTTPSNFAPINDSITNTPFGTSAVNNFLESDYFSTPITTNNTNNTNNTNTSIIQHNRTNSLPTSFKVLNSNQNFISNSNSSLRTTPLNTNLAHGDHCSFNINRFSLPAIVDDDNLNSSFSNNSLSSNNNNVPSPNSISSLERQLNNLSFEISPASYTPTRRNTLFSTASISSAGTTASMSSFSNLNQSLNQQSTRSCNATNNMSNFSSLNQYNNNNNNNNIATNNGNVTQNIDKNSPKLLPSSSTPSVSSSSGQTTNPSPTSSSVDLSTLTSSDIIILSKDQHGCRMLQKKIDDSCPTNLPLIFNATYKHSTALMLDPFGNYLIQKMMVSATPSQLSLIIIEITPNIEQIATNLHGTRALQKLIGCLSTPNHHDLIALAISPQIVKLVHDLNGNHVIQKLISHFFGDDLDFLINLIIINLIEIASHKHGCCVLQKLLNKCSPYQIQKISNEILRNSVHLMKDQFGNYVIQYLISLDIDGINYQLLQLVANQLVPLSCGKFSSNVVEKCLKLNPSDNLNNIHPLLAALLNIHVLMTLIKDQYGNYVVQTALEVANWPIKCVIAEMIRPMLPTIRYTNYGKRIHTKVIAILSELDNSSNNQANISMSNLVMNNNIASSSANNNNNNLLPGINFSTQN